MKTFSKLWVRLGLLTASIIYSKNKRVYFNSILSICHNSIKYTQLNILLLDVIFPSLALITSCLFCLKHPHRFGNYLSI